MTIHMTGPKSQKVGMCKPRGEEVPLMTWLSEELLQDTSDTRM